MITFLKNNFISLIVALLLLIVILLRTCSPNNPPVKPTIVRDTVWQKHDSLIYSKPKLVYSKPVEIPGETKYLPDTNYTKLRKQYQDLLILYFTKNVEKDSLKIDSLGYVFVTDTVYQNLIANRFYKYSFRNPVITTTITYPPAVRNQIYVGGALEGNTGSIINQINAGFLLKNKRDQIYGIYSGLNKDGQIVFGFQTYWKISFRKQ